MLTIRDVTHGDMAFWRTLDRHISPDELARKVRDRRGYVLLETGRPVGVLRWNLFWDSVPFLTLICLEQDSRGKGYGRQAMDRWEGEMARQGHRLVMTSTQVDEAAQHFYRRLGYMDRGSLFLDGTPFEQPQELMMLKLLPQR